LGISESDFLDVTASVFAEFEFSGHGRWVRR
jgi:hypothetical protein